MVKPSPRKNGGKLRRKGGRKSRAAAAPARDLAERSHIWQALLESEDRYRATFDYAPVGIMHTGIDDDRILYVNPKLVEMLGYRPKELLAMTSDGVVHPDHIGADQPKYRKQMLAGEVDSFASERQYVRKDGGVIWVNRTVSLARDPSGRPLHFIRIVEDITRRKLTEANLERLARARHVMAECRRVLVHAVEEAAMLQAMCDVVVASGGYRMSWVGLATGDDARPVRPAAHAGYEGDTPMTAPGAWNSGGRYQGFMHEVITTGKPHIARDILSDPRFANRRARAVQHGFQSSIALPLSSEGRIIGGLAIYAREPYAFDSDEISLLTEVADDIAFGLASLRARIEHERSEQRMREVERRALETFDQAAVGITRTDLNGITVEVNQKFCDLLGYTREEILGRHIREFTHPDDYGKGERFRTELASGSVTGSLSGEKRFVRKDGTVVWTRRTLSAARDEAGEVRYVVAVIEDITGRKEAEERYRSTFGNAPIGIMYTSIADDRLLQVNPKLCEMLGYEAEEMIGMATDDFIPPALHGMERGQYRQRMLDGELQTFASERRLLRKDGSIIWVNRTISLARDASGKPLYFIRVIEDITARKELEGRFRDTFEQAAVGIIHASLDGRYLRVNRKLCEISGYSEEELTGPKAPRLSRPEDIESGGRERRRLISGEIRSHSNDKRYLRKDGKEIWVNRTESLARDESGKPLYFIRVIEEITWRKTVEETIAWERALLRKIIDTVPDHVYVKDERGRFQLANRAWLNERNVNSEELLGKTVYDIFSAGMAQQMAQQDAEVIRTGVPILGLEEEVSMLAPGGSAVQPRWFSVTKVLMQDATGTVLGTVGISRNITEQKLSAQRREMEHAVTRVISEAASVEEAMPKMLAIICQAMNWSYGARWICDESTGLHRADCWSDFQPEFDPDDRDLWLHQGVNGSMVLLHRVWRHNEPTWIANIGEHRAFRRGASARKFGLHSAFAFPVVSGGDVIGVMEFFGRQVRHPDEILLQVMRSIGSQIGQFIRRKEAERALRESEEQFRQLAGNIPQVFWITDIGQRETLYVSQAAEIMLGRPMKDIVADRRILIRAVHREDRGRVYAARKAAVAGGYDETYRIVRPDGSIRWVHDRAFPVRDADGSICRIAGIAEDVTARKHAEERLEHLAHYDVLTGLPNRVLFYDRLKQALAQARRNKWTAGVMFIDADRFKNVNDTLGHAVGDKLLQQIAGRLTRSVRSDDTVGRLGGDEFAIALSALSSAQDASLVAQKIMAAFDEPFKLEGTEVYITVSIGVTLYPDDSADQDALIKNADAAMYRAKELGRNGYQFYMPEMNARALELLGMENSLRRALERNEFLVHYQPKASVLQGGITGLEALVRWKHPERGLVAPGEFIPFLEDSGLIMPVGEWVLKTVCLQIKAWERAGIKPVPVAVNLSARQFTAKDLGTNIKRILDEHQVKPPLIELEITESSLMANTEEGVRTLEYLDELGVGLSIDDFGTGYSSLSYLKRFPLDSLKIDRSFVRDLTSDPDDATITRAVISMAHSLGLRVIAEGVETRAQLEFLAEYGCDEVQGYYFARPMEADECGTWIRERRRLAQAERAGGPIARVSGPEKG